MSRQRVVDAEALAQVDGGVIILANYLDTEGGTGARRGAAAVSVSLLAAPQLR